MLKSRQIRYLILVKNTQKIKLNLKNDILEFNLSLIKHNFKNIRSICIMQVYDKYL